MAVWLGNSAVQAAVVELVRLAGLSWTFRSSPSCPSCSPSFTCPAVSCAACPACYCGAGAGASYAGGVALCAVCVLGFGLGLVASRFPRFQLAALPVGIVEAPVAVDEVPRERFVRLARAQALALKNESR